MDLFSILFAWPFYLLLEVIVRYSGFALSTETLPKVTIKYRDFVQYVHKFLQCQNKILCTIIKLIVLYFGSPGWVVTDFFKSKIRSIDEGNIKIKNAKRKFIFLNNTDNVIISTLLFLYAIAFHNLGLISEICIGILFWRFISRSIEIAYAFVNDILNTKNESGIKKNQRIMLALRSYFEIFIYSAAFYLALFPKVTSWGEALLNALYVGTLTNIDFVTKCNEFGYFVFVQVFTTLSLIILSIAGYLSNSKNVAIPHTHRPPRQ